MDPTFELADGGAGAPEPALAAVVRGIQRALMEVLGPAGAGEVLFRLGREWGREELERRAGGDGAPRERFEQGALGLGALGLGAVTLDELHLGHPEQPFRLVGRVADPLGLMLRDADRDGPVCALTAGYLAGLGAGLTGFDLVAAPFHCARECPGDGCRFELHPAHEAREPAVSPKRATGGARFFLDSLGAALGESEISLADLVENTSDAILLIDRDDVLRYWNRGAECMFQYAREEVVGRRIGFLLPADLLAADELGRLQRGIERDGRVDCWKTRRVRKDGQELVVDLTRTALHDGHGRIIGSTAIVRDVTDLCRTERQLSETRTLAAMGELAAKIAHEIKNPLAGISGAMQVLQRGAAADDPRREVYESVRQEVERLDATVQDLLCFARPLPPRLAPTDLRSFVRDVVDSLGCHHELAGRELAIDVAEELVVPLDARLMSQVLANLIHNAVQATARGGAIGIRGAARGSEVELEVADTGVGIAPDVLPAIFDPFFTTKSRGTGLGLAIAKKNVESHGGRIEVESTLGAGTRFRIALPLGGPWPES